MGEYFRICITDTIYLTELYHLFDFLGISFSEHGENSIYLLFAYQSIDSWKTLTGCIHILQRWMFYEDIGSLFFRTNYEYFFSREFPEVIEYIHHSQEDNPQEDRVERRKYPYIDDDESRDSTGEDKSTGKIDKSYIEEKPEKRSIYYLAKELYDRGFGPIGIESGIRKNEDPEDHSEHNKWIELILTNIRDSQLDKRDTISDRPEKIARKKESHNT